MNTKSNKSSRFWLLEQGHDFVKRHKIILFLIAACIVSIFYGLERCGSAEFVCTNGDYQNYNVIRRFLAGQIPYHDFANYLGMGPLILCAPFVALHNSFSASLFVTFSVAAFIFILFCGLIFYLVTQNPLISAFAALIMPKLVSSLFFYLIPGYNHYGYYITLFLELLLKPGNSFRIARMFLPIFLCLFLLLLVHRARHKGATAPTLLREWAKQPKFTFFWGLIVGAGLVWSNDFGFACIGSSFLILLIFSFVDVAQSHHWLHSFSRFLGFFPGLAIGALLSIFLVTRGHLASYFSFTSGVANWQFWYFGIQDNDKIYGLLDLIEKLSIRTWFHFGIYLICMLFCLYRLCKNKATDLTILFAFLYTSILAGQAVYIVGSGGDNFPEGNYGFFILLLFALFAKIILTVFSRLGHRLLTVGMRYALSGLSLLLLLFYCGYCGTQDFLLIRSNASLVQSDTYLPELEGISQDATALQEMKQIVGDHTLFSTYATALDDMLDRFQPTGCDYIIHALGDDQFNSYLEDFTKNKYDFVQTTNYLAWPWEPWVSKVSWPFYRELYSNYNLCSDHRFWSLWQYVGEDANILSNTAKVSVKQLDNQNVEITVTCDETEPCYADLILSWESQYTNDLSRFLTWQHAIFIYDPSLATVQHGIGEGYFQPKTGYRQHLSVYLENGEGNIILSSQPSYCTTLTVTEASCDELIRFVR